MRDMEIERGEYISQTEHALKGMFDLLRYYDGLFREAANVTKATGLVRAIILTLTISLATNLVNQQYNQSQSACCKLT